MRGDEGEGNGHAPRKAAVKNEGKERFSSRAEGEIYRVREGEDRHRAGDDQKH